ncbi:MAG: DnaA regulatory inactivator Hda [Gammaproteobacteria bacterium]
MHQLPLGIQLRPTAVFASFHAGRQAAAVAATRAVAEGRSSTPVWLWGPSGTGKSHLLQAALAAWEEGGRGTSAYLPLGMSGLAPAMLEGLEACGLVALDDVEAIAGRHAMEEALFHLWNGLTARGGRLLLAAAQPPAGAGIRLPDLASRFASSLVYQLAPPDDADLADILRLQAAGRGLVLGAEVAAFLLRRVRRDTHALARVVERLDAAALAAQRPLTVPFVRDVLGG